MKKYKKKKNTEKYNKYFSRGGEISDIFHHIKEKMSPKYVPPNILLEDI